MAHKFLPDDGHMHQYVDGVCTLCGPPPNSIIPDTSNEDAVTMAAADMAGAGGVVVATHEKFMVAVLTDEAIKGFAAEATRVLEWAKTLEITDNTTAKKVAGDLRSIAILKRNVEARKRELLAPLTDALKQMKLDIATIEAPLAEADSISRQKVTEWDAKQRQIQRDADDAIRLAAESAAAAGRVTAAGADAPDISAIQPVDRPADRGPLRPDAGGTVSMIDHWSAEIEDEDAIPRNWMMPNAQKLNLEARQRKGTRPIPGVKWVNNPTPSVR